MSASHRCGTSSHSYRRRIYSTNNVRCNRLDLNPSTDVMCYFDRCRYSPRRHRRRPHRRLRRLHHHRLSIKENMHSESMSSIHISYHHPRARSTNVLSTSSISYVSRAHTNASSTSDCCLCLLYSWMRSDADIVWYPTLSRFKLETSWPVRWL